MFYEQRTSVPDSVASLRAEYENELGRAIETVGLERAVTETGIERTRLEALLAGEPPELTLREAARIQALGDGQPDPDTVVELACEHLLLGMTTAVLDVDAVESHLDIDLGATEIQQKIERRAPMTFDEFVRLQYVIASRTP